MILRVTLSFFLNRARMFSGLLSSPGKSAHNVRKRNVYANSCLTSVNSPSAPLHECAFEPSLDQAPRRVVNFSVPFHVEEKCHGSCLPLVRERAEDCVGSIEDRNRGFAAKRCRRGCAGSLSYREFESPGGCRSFWSLS